MATLTGVTLFKVSINMHRIALCLHGNQPEPTCRACSIGLMMADLGTVKWYNDPELPYVRVVEGQVESEQGRQALARLIAYASNHIDPLDLLAIHMGAQPLWV